MLIYKDIENGINTGGKKILKLSEGFSIGLRAIGINKMRSLLTMLGIIVGVASVLAMIAVGDGAKICGYQIGVIWRWKNRHRKEIIWRKTGEIENAS